jgi:hypothetical protein
MLVCSNVFNVSASVDSAKAGEFAACNQRAEWPLGYRLLPDYTLKQG